MPPITRRALHEDAYITLTVEPALGLLRYVRTATPFPSIDAFRLCHSTAAAAVAGLDSEKLVVLIDSREGPARNDPAFEVELTRTVSALVSRFKAHAFLVKSAVGKLQARRLATSNGDDANSIFTNEADALRFLGVRASAR